MKCVHGSRAGGVEAFEPLVIAYVFGGFDEYDGIKFKSLEKLDRTDKRFPVVQIVSRVDDG